MSNKWNEVVGHRGCIHPCGGEPILKDKPDGAWVHGFMLTHCLYIFNVLNVDMRHTRNNPN